MTTSTRAQSAKGPAKPIKPVRVSRGMLTTAVQSANLGSSNQLPPPAPTNNANEEYASVIRLTLDDIESYEHNPRQKLNPNYLSIKDSIRVRGLETIISVTKRPGTNKYTLAKGGSTRRKILTELWEETGDRKFYEMDFLLVPYKSESDILASHISENLHRGDMSFWDKASGVVRLRRILEEEKNTSFTHTECVEQFKAKGLPDISRSLQALYDFADLRLQELGESKHELTMLAVRDLIQPGFINLKRLADAYEHHSEQSLQFADEIWPNALVEFDNGLLEDPNAPEGKRKTANWGDLILFVEGKIAQATGITPQAIQSMLSILKTNPKATWDEIQPPVIQGAPTVVTTSQPTQHLTTKLNRLPGTYAPTSSTSQSSGNNTDNDTDDDTKDRPPQHVVTAFKESQQAQRRLQQDLKAGGGITPALSITTEATDTTEPASDLRQTLPDATQTESPALADRQAVHATNTPKIIQLVTELAALSPTLVGSIVTNERLPIGWMIELPASVIEGTPLPPLAKQIFHFLSRASFQLHVVNHDAAQLEETNYWTFVNNPNVDWDLIQPIDGFEFLMAWLIDPENHTVGYLAQQILQLIKQQIADDPAGFTKLEYALDFRDLKLASQEQIQTQENILFEEFVKAGTHHELLRKFFPRQDLTGIPRGPRPKYDPRVEIVHAVWSAWENNSKSVPSEREQMLLTYRQISEIYPSITMTAIHSVISTE